MSCLWWFFSSASFPGLHFWGSAFHLWWWFYLHIYIHAPSQASNSSSSSTPSNICMTCLDHFHLALFLCLFLTPFSPRAVPNVFLWTCFGLFWHHSFNPRESECSDFSVITWFPWSENALFSRLRRRLGQFSVPPLSRWHALALDICDSL